MTPGVIRATGGRLRQLPQRATDRYLMRIIQAIRAIRPGIPIALVAPTPYRSGYYPRDRHHAHARVAAIRLASVARVGLVDPTEAVLPGLDDGSANPDGMHWSWAAHREVGLLLANQLAAQSD